MVFRLAVWQRSRKSSRSFVRDSGKGRRGGKSRRPLQLESLEARLPLDGSAALWTDAPRLTISFPADGTDVAGESSALYAEMTPLGEPGQWQATIVRALDTWVQAIGGQVQIIPDSGNPFGTFGASQGDPRFGDVRVASVSMPGGPVAFAVPHDAVVSGTWSGDIVFNSEVDFRNLDELYSVALHEAGHVLGLGHSTEAGSPMSVHGVSENLTPTAQDIAHLKALYGLRLEDETGNESGERREQENDSDDGPRNDQLFWAESLSVPPLPDQLIRYHVSGTIGPEGDIDYFALQPPTIEVEGLTALMISVRSTQPNGLIPDLAVYDEDGRAMKVDVLRNDNGLLIAQVEGAEPDDRVYLEVRSATTSSGFSTGGYDLVAVYEATPTKLTRYVELKLTNEQTETSMPLHVDRPQLLHLALEAKPVEDDQGVVAWVALYDEQGEVRYQAATPAGQTRSAPTVFLEPGDYRLVFHAETSDGSDLQDNVELRLIGANVSIPFGPGLVDPTTEPVLPCNEAGADPNYCLPAGSVVTDPIIWPGQPKPTTQPAVPVVSPVQAPDRWYWSGVQTAQTAAGQPRHNGLRPADVNNDGVITPLDALLVVTYLNEAGKGIVVDATTWFFDVNNDDLVSPIDVLFVLTTLA